MASIEAGYSERFIDMRVHCLIDLLKMIHLYRIVV